MSNATNRVNGRITDAAAIFARATAEVLSFK